MVVKIKAKNEPLMQAVNVRITEKFFLKCCGHFEIISKPTVADS